MEIRASTPTSAVTDASSSISWSQAVKSPQEAAHVSLSSMQAAIKNRIALRSPQQSNSSGETLSDHEISSVDSSEITTEEEGLDDHVEKILSNYAEKLAVIEKKRMAAIKQVEARTQNAQAVAMMKGMGAAVGSDIETKKKAALRKIEQEATQERTILFIQSKSELLECQKSLFGQIFNDYTSRLTAFPTFSEKLAASSSAVKEAFAQDQAVLESIGALDQKTDQELNATFTNLIRHDEARLLALKPLVKLSINHELNKIENTFSNFKDLIRQSAENLFIDQEHLALLREQFVSAKEAFFVAEAVDCSQARNVAFKNAEDFYAAVQELPKIIESASQAATRAQPVDQEKLDEKIALLQKLAAELTIAQQAWKQIAADSHLRIKTNHLDAPFFDLNILSKLETIPESQDDHWMIARRGEIEVVLPR
ncbi:MAG: hypothetical protein FJ390_06055, partial [Verrucomicrobia bacterium]|nr:hypothetical protein [Verrucomicrobiota bacterium]